MPLYHLRCAYRFTNGQSGLAIDAQRFEASDIKGAIQEARLLSADQPDMTLESAILSTNDGSTIWSLMRDARPETSTESVLPWAIS
ncbi:hypothetical protein [Methylobacterium durans]|uniref:Uncharacterized protein n=1 Tax=Methylobacterium durans TaxID=2202825 RepID=A0A2U8WE69_9HYPH|nr:hypothetical protein [Methylobacterium durans]AWN43780.1 hypothetical protein DK389_28775 [Methylobacterium durans]